MPQLRGRATSKVRTPNLIREYLMGSDAFNDRSGPALPVIPFEGDYISRMHQRVKARIRELAPEMQYPRIASFHALVGNLIAAGLVERTGATESAAKEGFADRVWVRVVSGRELSPLWNNPVRAAIEQGSRRKQALPLLSESELAEILGTTTLPRPTIMGRPEPELPPAPEPLPLSLPEQREDLLRRFNELMRGNFSAEVYRQLWIDSANYLAYDARSRRRSITGEMRADLGIMEACLRQLEAVAGLTQQQRLAALRTCLRGAELVRDQVRNTIATEDLEQLADDEPENYNPSPIPQPDFPERPNIVVIEKLIKHLELLSENYSGVEPGMEQELERLLALVQEWESELTAMMDEATGARAERLENNSTVMADTAIYLENWEDLPQAIDALLGFERA
jgi:hypothetical protein